MEIQVGDEYIIEQVSTCCVREKERIVRCKDCEYFTESMAWPGAHECDFINRVVEPDGYCAWGERRKA